MFNTFQQLATNRLLTFIVLALLTFGLKGCGEGAGQEGEAMSLEAWRTGVSQMKSVKDISDSSGFSNWLKWNPDRLWDNPVAAADRLLWLELQVRLILSWDGADGESTVKLAIQELGYSRDYWPELSGQLEKVRVHLRKYPRVSQWADYHLNKEK